MESSFPLCLYEIILAGIKYPENLGIINRWNFNKKLKQI